MVCQSEGQLSQLDSTVVALTTELLFQLHTKLAKPYEIKQPYKSSQEYELMM